jgi:uncharacterized protein with GYD domain
VPSRAPGASATNRENRHAAVHGRHQIFRRLDESAGLGAGGRRAAGRAALQAARCALKEHYFAFGAADAVVIFEAPDEVSAAAVSVALGASGTAAAAETTQLFTMEDAMSAITKAGQIRQRYMPPAG